MSVSAWQPDALRIGGLALAVGLLGAGLWVMWIARHRADDERARLPVLGAVGVPTCLTVALCMFGVGYHSAAYSLDPALLLPAIPLDRWWFLAGLVAVSLASATTSDWLERRHEGGEAG